MRRKKAIPTAVDRIVSRDKAMTMDLSFMAVISVLTVTGGRFVLAVVLVSGRGQANQDLECGHRARFDEDGYR